MDFSIASIALKILYLLERLGNCVNFVVAHLGRWWIRALVFSPFLLTCTIIFLTATAAAAANSTVLKDSLPTKLQLTLVLAQIFDFELLSVETGNKSWTIPHTLYM